MTESSTPAPTLKIRIRFDGAMPSIEEAPATLDMRRVLTALGAVVLIIAAVFGIRSMMKSTAPERLLAPNAEVAARPAEVIALSPPAPVVAAAPPHITEAEAMPRAPASSSQQTNRIVRAVLADTLRKHQPIQELAGNLPVSDVTKRFYFFTDVQDVASRRFTHRWEYRGKAVAQIPFTPTGKTWTGSSSKQIPTHMQGAWRVVLVDERGTELTSVAFSYGKELTAAQN